MEALGETTITIWLGFNVIHVPCIGNLNYFGGWGEDHYLARVQFHLCTMHRKLNWIDSHGLDSTATTTPCQEVDYSEKKDSRLEILFLSRSRAEFVLGL